MHSVAGNKERLAVSSRGKKYAVEEACSPPRAALSAETWYRRAYEESRAGGRPPPEGAGSALGSSGTPSPGSGTSSPGSFAGSPGPASPGIGTSSPGSLGGSPGFGTGSPGSGSGGGSSPGSDRGVWCENCHARLAALKRQALQLLLPGPGPGAGKDPAFPAVIHDKLQVPNATRKAWNDRDNRCDICATHLNQLKQEAVQRVLALEQAAAGSEHYDGSPGSPPPPLPGMPALVGSRHAGGLPPPRDWAFVPASYASSAYTAFVSNKHNGKPSSLGVGSGAAERKSVSPTHPGKVGLQMATSPSNGNILGSVAIQAHQYLDGTWSLSRTNGVTLYPYQISQLMTETGREGLSEAALNRYNADKPSAAGAPASQGSCVAPEPSTGTSVAASFFARAAQKLNLSSKKKKHRPSVSAAEPPLFGTSFSGILQTSPPPAPPCLLRAVGKVKDTPGLGKVKVMLRICSPPARDSAESSAFLKVDPRKKQVTLYDPLACGGQGAFQKRGSQVPPKMFAFDAVFPQDASQAEVCAGTVAEVIQSVVNGADGCLFCFGHAKLGKSYTMIGRDDSTQSLGIIPCAIAWLFKLINERKEKTGARFSVRVSAVEVWGREESLRDLLAEVATGSLQDGQSPGVYLCEDPVCGTQLQNQSELRAPTAEKAAFFLDAALAARRGHRQDCEEEDLRSSHMLFTLHLYQYRMEKSSKGGMSGGRSRLHLLDLGSCVRALSKSRDGGAGLCLSLSALGNVILALVNGSKHVPYKDSKLTMLLRESLGNVNCRTTMIAHISAAAGSYAETLSTVQIASRVLRMKKKKTKYTSSSSGGESSCEEGRMRRPTQLRPFQARAAVDPDSPGPPLSSDPDYSSSSEQSCDTVIYIGPSGTALSDKELTDNEGPPDFVPIVPALQKPRGDGRPPEAGAGAVAAAARKPERDCLKCNTFAELQERLDCIDGREEPGPFPFQELPAQGPPPGAGLCEPDKDDDAGPEGRLADRGGAAAPAPGTPGGHSPVPAAAPASPRSVPGGSGQQGGTTSQLVRSPSLQSSRESLTSCGFAEGKPRPLGSPRLGVASLSKTAEYRPAGSPSQRCKVHTQKGVLPGPAPPPGTDPGVVPGEAPPAEGRTPPVGMSPRVLKKSLSAGSQGPAHSPSEDRRPAAAPPGSQGVVSTTTVTVQQPLELNGEDELVFTLVEELTISGALGGRPASIISFNSDCSVQALASGSRPVSIIGSVVSEDLERGPGAGPVSEVSVTQFLPLPAPRGPEEKGGREAGSRRSSISSWLSETSAGSEGEQSCHSFVAHACFGHGEALADPPASELLGGSVQDTAGCRERPRAGPDGVLVLPELGEDCPPKAAIAAPQGCKVSALGKATVTISNTAHLGGGGGCVPVKTNITVYPCIALSPRRGLEPEAAGATAPHAAPPPESKEAGARKETTFTFEDPWLRREEEAKKETAQPGEDGVQPEAGTGRGQTRRTSPGRRLSGEAAASPGADGVRRVVDGCETAQPGGGPAQSPVHAPSGSLKSSSLPRAFQRGSRHELDGLCYRCAPETNGVTLGGQASRAALERKAASPKHGVPARPKGTPPLPPVRRSSLDQKNRASPQHGPCGSCTGSPSNQPAPFPAGFPDELGGRLTASSSSRLFSAKLEQLASRTGSLGRAGASHYECLSLERAESLASVSARLQAGKDSTTPRAGRSLGRGSGAGAASPAGPAGPPPAAGASPKAGQSRISAVSKLLLASPKARGLSAPPAKTLSSSTKSLPQSVGQSCAAPAAGGGRHMSWSTQSLSRSRGAGPAAQLPLRAANGRISELLRGQGGGGAGPRAAPPPRGAGPEEARAGVPGAPEDKPAAAPPLPSPYSTVTAPRRPQRRSSGHGSDNSSVLSGELPPAMGRTALFYHSGGSSGYESVLRDSEATGSASSAQDSVSENSSSVGGRCRSLKTPKKRSNSGSQRRRLIPALSLDTPSPARKPAPGAGLRWVDGPLRSAQRGLGEPFEIKVYEIDDVERLQRRRGGGGKEGGGFNAKLRTLERRQQRIAEVRAKYEWLMQELEATKQHLMLDPDQWLSEFDLEQVWELDSLEHLEALECVTERLESRVNFCKAHLMMITCFDITSRRR
ncbi:kinesin-like protein KIF26B isoform X1 [Pipistrellus kuhlii]|uniref:Kinesin family member 26B n=2 Tax=Pipistrellus kuhlii TaxID=59472 RepID=A0A7J7TP44_PIPKU|nr:kinesin-like protein KIF26B isoform X1 [Pipistrellus kuhlii]KAF6302519.1 kinesin family member 26B [Pipistrellus kuhlii]